MEVFLYADGGSRGNPGVAGSGAVLINAATKETLVELVYAFDKPATNNVAEYRAWIEGLRAAAELGTNTVHVFMDSKLVIEQMSGRWKIKHPDMQVLAKQARELAQGFSAVSYTWVPRAQNAHADKLSNDAMDASAAGAPEGLVGEKPAVAKPATEESGAEQPVHDSAQWRGAKEKPTRLIFLRHGQTPRTAEKKYAGHEDVDLNELGEKQARGADEALKDVEGISAVISSPLLRCVRTAEVVGEALGKKVKVEPGFVECNFGDFDGLTMQQAKERFPELHDEWMADPSVAPPSGEALTEVYARVKGAVRGVVEKHQGETVVIVTHVNPIKAALGESLGSGTQIFSRLFLDPASMSVIDYYSDDANPPAVVLKINDVSHLRGISA